MKVIEEIDILHNKKLMIGLNVVALVLLYPAFLGSFLSAGLILWTDQMEFSLSPWDMLFLLLLFVPVIILHELIHGAFFKLFQPEKKLKFGLVGYAAYCISPGSLYSKKQMLVIGLAPFVMMTSLFALLLAVGVLPLGYYVFLLAVHTLGCVGDFYYAYLILWRHRKHRVLIEDSMEGIVFYEAP